MSYGYDKRIRYSECDGVGVLRYDALVDIFQDCTTFQSEDIGLGLTKLLGMDLGWMLSYWQIDIDKLPSLGDNVYIGTVPYGLKGCIGSRNFYMKSGDDMIIKSNSIWVLMNLQKQMPEKIPDEMYECYDIEEKLDMEYLPRKIKIPELSITHTSRFTVEKFFLDSNGHMNNAWFVRLAQVAFPEIPKDRHLSRICVEYKKQARLHDVIILDTYEAEDGFYIDMKGDSNISYAICCCKY